MPNAIGTAYMRLDLLPGEAQPRLRDIFRQYVDSRLATYRKLPDLKAAYEELARGTALQRQVWDGSVAACVSAKNHAAAMLLLPALNQMIDITNTRTLVTRIHPPVIVFIMLGMVVLASSLLAGYGMGDGKKRSLVHMIAFATIIALTVYVILDMEYPRMGLLKISAFDQALVELRQSMN